MCFEVITVSNGFYKRASYYNRGHKTNKIALWPFSEYFKFITYANNTFYIFWGVLRNFQLLPQIAHMVVDCLAGVVGIILVPDQFHNQLISKYPFRVSN